ncbi:hypothetical protein [Micromonospora rubida]
MQILHNRPTSASVGRISESSIWARANCPVRMNLARPVARDPWWCQVARTVRPDVVRTYLALSVILKVTQRRSVPALSDLSH